MRYQLFKLVANLVALKSAMVSQWPTVRLMNSGNTLWVDVADQDPNPTNFITSWIEPPAISATSDHPMGPFNHYQGLANGSDVQTILVQMINPDGSDNVDWDGVVLVQPLSPVQVSSTTVTITNGQGTFTVGPTTLPGEYDLYMLIQGDTLGYSWYRMHLSFI